MSRLTRHRLLSVALGAPAIVVLTMGPTADAATVTVLCSNGLRAVLSEVAPTFARDTGHTLAISYSVSAELKKRVDAGEPFDVAILTPGAIAQLTDAGTVIAGTQTTIARSGMGISMRQGARRPDLRSVDALKASLLAAKSIAFAKEGAGGIFFVSLIQRLGLPQQLEATFKRVVTGQDVSRAVANGEAELGVQPISEILNVPGVELAGSFPADVQDYSVMVAGIAAQSSQRSIGQRLIDFLLSPASDAIIRSQGMERIP